MGQSSCSVCNYAKCEKCRICVMCTPIHNCDQCLSNDDRVIKWKFSSKSFSEIEKIYQSGVITAAYSYASTISSSKIPFTSKILHHCLLVLTVETQGKSEWIEIDCERTSAWKDGKFLIQIKGVGVKQQMLTNTIPISRKSFKDFYNYLKNNWQQKQYHRYKRNCYDLVVKSILHLEENAPSQQIVKITSHKDEQVAKYWIDQYINIYLNTFTRIISQFFNTQKAQLTFSLYSFNINQD